MTDSQEKRRVAMRRGQKGPHLDGTFGFHPDHKGIHEECPQCDISPVCYPVTTPTAVAAEFGKRDGRDGAT